MEQRGQLECQRLFTPQERISTNHSCKSRGELVLASCWKVSIRIDGAV